MVGSESGFFYSRGMLSRLRGENRTFLWYWVIAGRDIFLFGLLRLFFVVTF